MSHGPNFVSKLMKGLGVQSPSTPHLVALGLLMTVCGPIVSFGSGRGHLLTLPLRIR